MTEYYANIRLTNDTTMDYSLIKSVHVTTVTLSGLGFAVRFAGTAVGAGWVNSRLARTLPHVNDTLLLISAITLAVLLRANPLEHPWLLAKILALLVYIGLGMIALKASRPRSVRLGSGIAALIVFGYIVSVAVSRQPAGLLQWMF